MDQNKPMKNNRLYFQIILLTLLISFKTATAQTKLGVRAGFNAASAIIKNEDDNENSTQSIPGIHVGLTVELPIKAGFYLQPAALYSTKGFKQKDNWFSGKENDFKAKVSYIEVPINLLYKPAVGTGTLLLGAGPYVGYGTSGKWETDTDVLIGDIRIDNQGDIIFKNDVMDGEFGNYLYGKPWDYGVNVLAGYEFFRTLSIQLNAQLGLANLQPEVDGIKRGGKFKNTSLGISLGYKFQ